MKPTRLALCFVATAAITLRAEATPVSVTDVFAALVDISPNDMGFPTGESLFIGADLVSPSGSGLTGSEGLISPNMSCGSPGDCTQFGTTGRATSPVLTGGNQLTYNLPFHGNTGFPFQVSTGEEGGLIPITNPNEIGHWSLTFSNATPGYTSTTVTTPIPASTPAPFAANVTVSSSGGNTVLGWASGGAGDDGVFISIYDKNLCSNGTTSGTSLAACRAVNPNLSWPDEVVLHGIPGITNGSLNSLPTTGNVTIPTTNFNPAHTYTIEVSESTTRNGTDNTTHSNESAISRAELDFTVLPSSAPNAPIAIPVVTAQGTYQFNDTVTNGHTLYIDPTIATGFVYQIGVGNPDIASVLLPDLQGSDPYTITWDDGADVTQLLGGDIFNFLTTDPFGVSGFTVTGIHVGDNIDTSDPTAFITGLTFTGFGTFTGTMTALVPEPASLALFGTAVIGLGALRRRKRNSHKARGLLATGIS